MRVSEDEGKAGCIGKCADARVMYVAKYVMVAECVLGILHPHTDDLARVEQQGAMRNGSSPVCLFPLPSKRYHWAGLAYEPLDDLHRHGAKHRARSEVRHTCRPRVEDSGGGQRRDYRVRL